MPIPAAHAKIYRPQWTMAANPGPPGGRRDLLPGNLEIPGQRGADPGHRRAPAAVGVIEGIWAAQAFSPVP